MMSVRSYSHLPYTRARRDTPHYIDGATIAYALLCIQRVAAKRLHTSYIGCRLPGREFQYMRSRPFIRLANGS